MTSKFLVMYDCYGHTLGPVVSVVVTNDDVAAFRVAVVKTTCLSAFPGLDASELEVYTCARSCLARQHIDTISGWGNSVTRALVVVVPSPYHVLLPRRLAARPGRSTAVWYGARTSSLVLRDAHIVETTKLLPRGNLLNDVMTRLARDKVVLCASPEHTGKSLLAALVGRHALAQSGDQKVAVVSVSCLFMSEKETIGDVVKRQCETQRLYDCVLTPWPRATSAQLWTLVRKVLDGSVDGIHILLLSTCGAAFAHLVPPMAIPSQVDLVRLYFEAEEIRAFVTTWFMGVSSLGDAIAEFCSLLKDLTGGHVGLTATAIEALNQAVVSRWRSVSAPLKASDWVFRLQRGSLEDPGQQELLECLVRTRPVQAFNAEDSATIPSLQRLMVGASMPGDTPILEQCVHTGILVRTADSFEFASRIMAHRFLQLLVAGIERR